MEDQLAVSREGICAVATLLIMAIYGAGWCSLGTACTAGLARCDGLLWATVFTTSMIYAQMKTVPRWQHWTTPALFLLLSLAGGALLSGNARVACLLVIIGGRCRAFAWFTVTGVSASGTTMETATGLGHIGTVRAFEPPHTGTNYLMREFIHEVGRKHALQLRVIALVSGIRACRFCCCWMRAILDRGVGSAQPRAGVLALRWLFFAQAEHVVGLYYGKR